MMRFLASALQCNPPATRTCGSALDPASASHPRLGISAEEWCDMNFTMPWNATKPAKNGWSAPIEDVKQQIGQQVDHLVQVASQVSRDAAAQAAQVSRDAAAQAANATQGVSAQAATAARDFGGQALKATQDAGVQAAAVAREVPSGASGLLQQILDGATRLGREARAVRVTREPPRAQRGPDVVPGVALLAGFGG